jgi:adenosine deaminase
VRKLTLNGFKSAFMPYRKKTTIMNKAARDFDALVEEFERTSGQKAITDPQIAKQIALQISSEDARRHHLSAQDVLDSSMSEINSRRETIEDEEEAQ